MIAFLILGGLFFLIVVPILAISANVRSSGLRGEIARLESAVASLQRRIVMLEKAKPSPPTAAPVASVVPVAAPVVVAPAPEPEPIAEPEAPAEVESAAQPAAPAAAPAAVEAEPEAESEPVIAPEPVAEPEPAIAAREMPAAAARPAAKAAPRNFEQRLGGGVFIWIGAVMLALAGAFLVKYSIDVGLLSPGVRVVLGLLLGAVLLGGGQWLRKDSPNIAQALAAAAVADWFASLFAATALYHLISPTFGFVCLAIVTAIGILLALREGPFVGLVGIAGGFITPAIVSSDTPQPGVLFVYLFLIQLGTLVLQHKRGWWYLTALGIGGGLLWALGWTLLDHATADTLLAVPRLAQVSLPLFLLATDLTQLWSLHGKGGVAVSREMTLTARAASIACFAIMAWWLIGGDYRLDDWGFLIALSLAHLAAARRFTKEEIPALVGAAIVILAYASWSPVSEVWGSIAFGGARFIRDRTGDFIAIGLALGAFYGAGGVALAHRASNPTRWAGLSTFGTAFLLGGAYINLRDQELWLSWFALALVLAALHAAAALWLQRMRQRDKIYTGALGLHILAASGFLALSVPIEVEHEWIAVSWAFELPVMALVAWRLDLPWVRRGIWAGGALIVAAVLDSGFPAGEGLIFNRLLYGIGIPCIGMIVTAQILKRMAQDREGRLLVLAVELAGAGLLALLIGLEIDHFIGRVAPDSGRDLVRAGSMSIAWAAIALGLFRLYYRTTPRDQAVIYAARAFTVISIIALIGGCFLMFNPLFGTVDVGRTWFFNRLLIAYAIPAGMMMLLAETRRREPPPEGPVAAQALAVLSFVTAFLWIALTVRQIAQGSEITFGPATGREFYGYAGSWTFLLPLMAFVAAKRGYKALHQAIWLGVLLILVAIGASGLSTGEWLIFNPPLYGVGVPMIGLLGTALYVERTTEEKEGRVLVTALPLIATALFALLVWLEVTQVVGRFTFDSAGGFLRNGLVSIAWAAVALGFFRFEKRKARKDRALLYAAYGFTALTAAAIVLGGFILANPLLQPIDVGDVAVFNRLLAVYAVPAALLLLLADRLRQQSLGLGSGPAQGAGLLALVTGFFWVTLTVRQIAHGALLDSGPITDAEQYGYSAAWTLYGLILLAMGTWKHSQVLRYASAVVILLTVSKVFLIDASDLTGLYRVASFLGLGLSLIGIGYLYQRLLFRRGE